MPSVTPYTLNLTRAQALALAKVGRDLAPQIHALWPDLRRRAPIINVIDALEDQLDGVSTLDPFEIDLDYFLGIFPLVRHAEFAEVIRSRMRDLIAVTVLWRALEDLSNVEGLLGVPRIDDLDWRAEVLDLLIDRGVEVLLPGERGEPG